MTASLFPLDRAAFVKVRCAPCWGTGPAAALDGPTAPLHAAAREHLTQAHPGAPDDAFTIEPGRAVMGWDGIEPPHEWYGRIFPPSW
ncbi:hypothetical protein ACIGW4_32985 [Streptomyces sp. NPDC053513]|uniref:hypothetical protein n=1 Tax=unclassified Streptomyces TaxID=2593676 RepID=UPI0037D6EE50